MKGKIFGLIIFILIIASIILPAQENLNINTYYEKNIDKENKLIDNDIEWWPMFHHDIQLTGFTSANSPDTNKNLWENYIDNDIWFSSPSIVDNNLFIGTGHRYDILSKELPDFINFYEKEILMKDKSFFDIVKNDGETLNPEIGKLYRLNAKTGEIIWDFEAEGSVFSSPTAENGLVYFVSADSNNYSGKIYCLNIDSGNEIWSLPVMTGYTTPTLHNGKIYLLTINPDDYFGKLICLDAVNGNEIWNETTGYIDFSLYTAPAIYDEKVFFTSVDVTEGIHCKISCLNESTGQLLWDTKISEMNFGYALSSPVVDKQKVYVISADTKDPDEFWCVLSCFDTSNGSILWNYTMKEINNELSFASPAVAYGNVYFTLIGEDWTYGKIICLNDMNGSVIWVHKSDDAYTLSSPIISSEKVFVGGLNVTLFEGNLLCFDAFNGNLIYKVLVDQNFIDSTPGVAADTIYVGSSFGKICAYKDIFKVGEIKGGLAKVKTDITNVGSYDILGLNYNISVVGGIFNQINAQINETIDVLEARTSDKIKASPIFGFGKIEVTITIELEDLNPVIKKADGFIFGIFVFIK